MVKAFRCMDQLNERTFIVLFLLMYELNLGCCMVKAFRCMDQLKKRDS